MAVKSGVCVHGFAPPLLDLFFLSMVAFVKNASQLFRRIMGCLVIAMFVMSIAAPCFAEIVCKYGDVSCAAENNSDKTVSSDKGEKSSNAAADHCCAMHSNRAPALATFELAAYATSITLLQKNYPSNVKDPLQGLFRPPQA